MAYNEVNCTQVLGNTGQALCTNNLGADAKLLITLDSFSFASLADAQNQSKYQDAINERVMFPFPLFKGVEPAIEDDTVETTGMGFRLFVREGKYGGIGRYQLAACNLPKLRTFNNVKLRAFIITLNDKIYGTSPDGVEFKGFKLSNLVQSGFKGTDGTEQRKTQLAYQFASPSEMFDFPAIPQLTWSPLQLTGLIDVTVTASDFANPTVTVSVIRKCDLEPVSGLVEGDFTVLDSSGVEQLPSDNFVDNGGGIYSFTFNSLATDLYSVNLKNPADQLTGGYQSDSADYFGTVSLWNFPSKDEFNEMWDELHLEGVGGFSSGGSIFYQTSSEFNATTVWGMKTSDNTWQNYILKSNTVYVRASRSFIAPSGTYSLRDVGPGGGLVYYIDSTTYYEAYATDQSAGYIWSNINNVLIGTTGTAIGTGLQNTADIIAQSGHITSAASICHLLNPGTFSEWFLPNDNEQSPMYTNLKSFGLGGFASDNYWGSRERNANEGFGLSFASGNVTNASKAGLRYVRACRTFRSNTTYALKDIGPGGGYVFYIDVDQYYEENGSNLSNSKAWSNITGVEIGLTAQNQAIGTGILNTAAIIGQSGHTDSAAKLCNDYSV